MLSGQVTVVASSNQVTSSLADEVVILGLHNGIYYGLEGVGAFIWSVIQKPTKIPEIIASVLQRYDVQPEMCEQDVYSLLNELLERDLIEIVATSS